MQQSDSIKALAVRAKSIHHYNTELFSFLDGERHRFEFKLGFPIFYMDINSTDIRTSPYALAILDHLSFDRDVPPPLCDLEKFYTKMNAAALTGLESYLVIAEEYANLDDLHERAIAYNIDIYAGHCDVDGMELYAEEEVKLIAPCKDKKNFPQFINKLMHYVNEELSQYSSIRQKNAFDMQSFYEELKSKTGIQYSMYHLPRTIEL